jgi:hypothetical protein
MRKLSREKPVYKGLDSKSSAEVVEGEIQVSVTAYRSMG